MSDICTKLKMVCLRWLLVMALLCGPGFGSKCSESSICNEFRDVDKTLDCVHLCMSVVQPGSPDLRASAQQGGQGGDDDDDGLLLSIILSLTSEDKTSESDLSARSDERRSYSMEHFRWGKPAGRKRRPVKVFFSSLEGGVSPGGSLLSRARRNGTGGKGGALKARHRNRSSLRPRGRPSGLPEKKHGPYRMSHFRWGSPPASKRNDGFMKLREENRQEQLAKFLQNIFMKDI